MFKGKLHPATLPFQGIRIEVNNELGVLEELFEQIENANFTDTKVAIISFHSLEDRIVKQVLKNGLQKCICPSHIERCECGNNHAKGKVLTRKPIIPTKQEIKVNARSRSSKMRVFKFESQADKKALYRVLLLLAMVLIVFFLKYTYVIISIM